MTKRVAFNMNVLVTAVLRLMTFNNDPAFFTSVSGTPGVFRRYFFKIIQLPAVYLEAFRTMSLSKFLGSDLQMAAPAPQQAFLFRQQDQYTVLA